MARRTILLSEVNLTEETVNQVVSGNLSVTGTSTFTGQLLAANGSTSAPSYSFANETNTGMYLTAGVLNFTAQGTTSLQLTSAAAALASTAQLNWAGDAILVRDAANTIAMKNAATAQTMRIYGDATAATLKYMTLTHNGTNGLITTSGGTFGFGTHTTSTGTNINGVTGYISIVDSGGTPRRLAVLT